jgi:hypothetical protein
MNVDLIPRHCVIDTRQDTINTPGYFLAAWDSVITRVTRLVWWGEKMELYQQHER